MINKNMPKPKRELLTFSYLYILMITVWAAIKQFSPTENDFLYRYGTVPIYLVIYIVMLFHFDVIPNAINKAIKCLHPRETKHKIAAVLISSFYFSLCVGKVLLMIETRRLLSVNHEALKNVIQIIVWMVTVPSEEFLFTCFLHETLKKIQMPYFVNVLLVCMLFAFWHVDFRWQTILVCVGFRLIILISYRFYPNIFIYILYHLVHNASTVIPYL